jgi:hypothetical protein
MDLKTIGCEGMEWNSLAQDRVKWQAFVTIISEDLGFIKAAKFLEQ